MIKSIEDAAALLSVEETVILEVDCWNHLRNVWLGGMTKELSKYLKVHLCEDLECIDSRLRVTPSIDMILRAVDKEFSLCANYPKGHGEIFHEWIEKNHPGALLIHVERTSGSRQDLCVEGAGAVYWNRIYWLDFIDERLRTPGDNILQENLFIILSSCEIVALTRVCSIIHLSICLPIRWLAGNSHKLMEYDWSVRSMGKVIDMLEMILVSIVDNGASIVNEELMMGICINPL